MSLIQCQEPTTAGLVVTFNRASTAALFATGAVKRTEIGWPTPTTSLSPGTTRAPSAAVGATVVNVHFLVCGLPRLGTTRAVTLYAVPGARFVVVSHHSPLRSR